MAVDNRIVCWFSYGAASAIATYLALKKYGDRVTIANIYIKDEHEDNARFLADCERWYGRQIIQLRNDEYGASVDEVIERRRYLSGPQGAPCTGLLKKVRAMRFNYPMTCTYSGTPSKNKAERAERWNRTQRLTWSSR